MPLVKSPTITPRKLAANRANGRRSVGPRTQFGKDRSMLNALKHGRYSQAFRSNLLKAREDVALYDWIYARVCQSFRPVGKPQWRECERLARETWCLLQRERAQKDDLGRPLVPCAVYSMAWFPWRQGGLEKNPRYVVKSTVKRLTFLSTMEITQDPTALRLKFWVRRPRRGSAAWIRARDLRSARLPAHGNGAGGPTPSEDSAPVPAPAAPVARRA